VRVSKVLSQDVDYVKGGRGRRGENSLLDLINKK
jgi:hypothetical protein